MPHQIPKLIFLVFLNLVVASPVLFGRRDELGGADGLWGLDLEDVIGAGVAGLEALTKLWDFSTAPPAGSTIPSGAPPKQPDEGILESPNDPVEFPLFQTTKMKTCSVAGESQRNQFDRFAVEESRWQVEQEPETGRPVINACDLPPPDNINDAYIVREIRFEEGRLKTRWPAHILVSDPVKNVHFRYKVIRVGTSTTYKYQKIPNAVLMRQGKLLKLGYVRRWGWLVGGAATGQPKEVALKWFEDEVMGTTRALDENIAKMSKLHYSAAWIAKVMAKATQSGSPYWIPDQIDPQSGLSNLIKILSIMQPDAIT